MVYDGLVGFKRVGGTDGNTLVPDLASALPTPTDNGRTYTFRLREGIKFADGRELKASAVRSSLERLFRAKTPRPGYYDGIVGAPACRKQPKRCDLSKGVLTDNEDGDRHDQATRAGPDFLYKLALPFASVVPTRHTRDGRQARARYGPVPDRRVQTRRILVRIPPLHVPAHPARPQPPLQGVVEGGSAGRRPGRDRRSTSGAPPDAWVTAVERRAGRLPRLLSFPASRLQEARTRYAAQLHITPTAASPSLCAEHDAAALRRPARPPGGGVRGRPRTRIVEGFGGNELSAPTCQLLPPNFPGYQRYCPYTLRPTKGGAWTAPDLVRARRLVAQSGTEGMRVDVSASWERALVGLHNESRPDAATRSVTAHRWGAATVHGLLQQRSTRACRDRGRGRRVGLGLPRALGHV